MRCIAASICDGIFVMIITSFYRSAVDSTMSVFVSFVVISCCLIKLTWINVGWFYNLHLRGVCQCSRVAASLIINPTSKHGISRWIFQLLLLSDKWPETHCSMRQSPSSDGNSQVCCFNCFCCYCSPYHYNMINATLDASNKQMQQPNKQSSNSHKAWQYIYLT